MRSPSVIVSMMCAGVAALEVESGWTYLPREASRPPHIRGSCAPRHEQLHDGRSIDYQHAIAFATSRTTSAAVGQVNRSQAFVQAWPRCSRHHCILDNVLGIRVVLGVHVAAPCRLSQDSDDPRVDAHLLRLATVATSTGAAWSSDPRHEQRRAPCRRRVSGKRLVRRRPFVLAPRPAEQAYLLASTERLELAMRSSCVFSRICSNVAIGYGPAVHDPAVQRHPLESSSSTDARYPLYSIIVPLLRCPTCRTVVRMSHPFDGSTPNTASFMLLSHLPDTILEWLPFQHAVPSPSSSHRTLRSNVPHIGSMAQSLTTRPDLAGRALGTIRVRTTAIAYTEMAER